MTSLDFHPDDLLDRSRRNMSLSAAERDRLKAHLLGCSVCRFVQQAARDFDDDVPMEDVGTGIPSYLADAIANYGAEGGRAVSVGGRRAWGARSPRLRGVATAVGIVLLTGIAAAAQWVNVFHRSPLGGMRAISKSEAVSAGTRRNAGENAARPLPKGETAIVVAPSPAVAAEGVGLKSPAAAAAIPRATQGQALAAIQTRQSPKAKSRRPAQVVQAPTPLAAPTAADIFVQANMARRSGNADRALDLYERVLSEHGGSAEAQTSRAIVGRLLLDRHAPEAALKKFDEYLAVGIGDLREEVMIGRAGALAQLDRLEQERATWTALLRMFPHSAYAGHARSRIQALTTLLSR